jgi:O-antigen ligase
MGYVTWAAVGLLLGALRWRKALLLVPSVLLFLLVAVPGVSERMMQGFSGDYDVPAVNSDPRAFDDEGPDIYTVTAGRTIAWRLVAEKIREAPAVGWGRQAMLRTGVARDLLVRFGEEFGHPHNAYLEMLLDNGIVGFLAVIPFYFVVLRQGVSLFLDVRDPAFAAVGGVTLSLVVALLVASMGSQTFYPREGAVPMWCAIGLMLRVHVERSRGFSWEGAKAAIPEEKPFWAPRP